MALTKNVNTKPSFEDDDQHDVAETKNVSAQEAATQAAEKEVHDVAEGDIQVDKPATQVAKAKTGGLVASGVKFGKALEAQKNAIDPSEIDYRTFSGVKVGLEGFKDDAHVYGKEIILQVLSFHDTYMVSPGGAMSTKTTPLVKYSLDGVNLDDGTMSVEEYIKQLREDGHPEAKRREYVIVTGVVLSEVNQSNIVTVQFPPMSIPKFNGYRMTQGLLVAQGKREETDIIKLTQKSTKGKNATFAEIDVSAYYPEVTE